jgi:phosphatidylglycerol lysyltransferase
MEKHSRSLRLLGPILVVAIFVGALWLLHHEIRHYHLHDIRHSLAAIGAGRVWLAVVLTAVSYLLLMGCDLLAVRWIGHPLSPGRIALASFAGCVTSHNFGAILGGTSVRYRLYSAWGFSAVEIIRLVFMLALTTWLGIVALGGIVFVLDPFPLPVALQIPIATVRPLGAILLGVLILYLIIIACWSKPVFIWGSEVRLPGLAISVLQIVISAAELTAAAAALYILLPERFGMGLFQFLGIYLLAVVVVIFSHVPGGVGVFELMVLKLAGAQANESVVAALLIYRGVYYLLPLLAAVLLLAGREILEHRFGLRRAVSAAGRAFGTAIPPLLALVTFASGGVLLCFGSLPPIHGRLAVLERIVPLPLLEISHFVGSLIGAALLLLARGLERRLDSAWWLTTGLLSAGIAFSLMNRGGYEEALVLAIALGALVACRQHFYRRGSLLHSRFTRGWLTAILLVILCSIWLGFFVHRHVEYSSELWWKFAFHSDAPRFLRATAGVTTLLLIFAIRKLLAQYSPSPRTPSTNDLQFAEPIVRASRRSETNLALVGDKSFLFNQNRTGFVMYAVQGRSWVALGSPIGPETEREELVWLYHELVDRHDGWPVFYQVAEEDVPLYLDQGLTLLKLGEEGRVPLTHFSLEGNSRKGLRHTHHKLQREQCVFEIVPRESVSDILPELKSISDSWLAERKSREKRFSLGFFDEDYLKHFPCAVVRKEGELIAFANILEGAERDELSIDLMRYRSQSPPSLMEYLLIELMLWGKAAGYRWFNLGMAPLSGINDRRQARLWNRAARLVFRHGERFYGFRGLRQYKEKFDPQWSPRYLASPGGLALARILADVITLINRPKREIPDGAPRRSDFLPT